MHLDTNYLVALSQNGSRAQEQAAEWITDGEPLVVSAMAWAEFLCGPLQTGEEAACAAILSNVLPVDPATATLGAQLFNHTGRRSRSLPDCLIAATAILGTQPLATFNREDFTPFVEHGLELA